MNVIGITGRIGSGKSTLARILERKFGCPLICADELGHEALQRDHRVRAAVLERFGPGILDPEGAIDRSLLASFVFSDSEARGDLNALVHPWIVEHVLSQLAVLRERGDAGIVVIDAALLLDWTDRLLCDRIVVVRCADDTAVRRLAGRGIGEAEAKRRLASQDPEDRFLRHADFVVGNDGTVEELEEQALRLWESLNPEEKEKSR